LEAVDFNRMAGGPATAPFVICDEWAGAPRGALSSNSPQSTRQPRTEGHAFPRALHHFTNRTIRIAVYASFTLTSSMPAPLPRLRLYFLSAALFQCSWTPMLASALPVFAGS